MAEVQKKQPPARNAQGKPAKGGGGDNFSYLDKAVQDETSEAATTDVGRDSNTEPVVDEPPESDTNSEADANDTALLNSMVETLVANPRLAKKAMELFMQNGISMPPPRDGMEMPPERYNQLMQEQMQTAPQNYAPEYDPTQQQEQPPGMHTPGSEDAFEDGVHRNINTYRRSLRESSDGMTDGGLKAAGQVSVNSRDKAATRLGKNINEDYRTIAAQELRRRQAGGKPSTR